jgi:fluoroquinolone resistance protein|tara:strand:+ start:240 stop:923 length:684 start_codon:yes stop_codon:yes gene_type:complete
MGEVMDIQIGEGYTNLDLRNKDFSGQDLTDCTFSQCQFAGSVFRGANLTNCQFDRCQFNNSDPDEPASFAWANLREAVFSHCDLNMVAFNHCLGYDLSFKECQMQGADLSLGDFKMPVGNLDLAALTITDCNFSYGNLSNTFLVGCKLSNNRLTECLLDFADLSDADLSDSEMFNVSARNCKLKGADLRGASFNNLDLKSLDLEGVRLYYNQLPALVDSLHLSLEEE